MMTVAQFNLSADDFPLGVLFRSFGDVEVELECVIPVEEGPIPFFWVRGPATADFVDVFDESTAFSDVTVVDRVGDEYLLRAVWDPSDGGLLRAILDSRVTLLSGEGNDTGWQFEIRAGTHGQLAEFERTCRDLEIDVDLLVLQPSAPHQFGEVEGLTEKQREALVLAHDRGYFSSPRTTSLEEIAAELGISRQSLSSRIRRGLFHLVGRTLKDAEDAR